MKKNNEIIENCKSGGVFPDEETFQRIYSECTEDQPSAPQKLQDAYRAMRESFEQYLVEIEEYSFRYAFEYGFKAAMEGGAVTWKNSNSPEPLRSCNISA